LREAALSQKQGRVAATRSVSRKIEPPKHFVCLVAGIFTFFASRVFGGNTGYLHFELPG
jgi:hypothetical protein